MVIKIDKTKNQNQKPKLKFEIPNINITSTIYDSLITNLKYALTSLDMESLIEGEMPYDKLIISITNIVIFVTFTISFPTTTWIDTSRQEH